jgi:hypothetical protein
MICMKLKGGQQLWYTMIDALHRLDAAMRFKGSPITSGGLFNWIGSSLRVPQTSGHPATNYRF